jgi:hypothetical protein
VPDEIDALINDVTVDAYGDGEQLEAFRQAFEDLGSFPFAAHVVGAEIQLVAVDYDGNDQRGLVAVCRRAGQRHTVALLDITPTIDVDPATARLIDAYRRWSCADPLPRRTRRRASVDE